MRQDVLLSLYFLLLATLVLLLAPNYLLADIKLVQIIREATIYKWMPQKLDNSPLDKLPENECKQVPLNCPWIIASKDETLTVIITCLKWTFNYGLWIRVTVHPEGNSDLSKQIDLNDYHPLLKSLSEALNLYEIFPEPHLNSFQVEILDELIDDLDFKFE